MSSDDGYAFLEYLATLDAADTLHRIEQQGRRAPSYRPPLRPEMTYEETLAFMARWREREIGRERQRAAMTRWDKMRPTVMWLVTTVVVTFLAGLVTRDGLFDTLANLGGDMFSRNLLAGGRLVAALWTVCYWGVWWVYDADDSDVP